jgi:hypothetical protein
MRVTLSNCYLLIMLSFLFTGCSKQISFSKSVMPILEAKCLSCHAEGSEIQIIGEWIDQGARNN